MELIKLAAESRTGSGKGSSRQLRFAGYVPAVIYSGGKPAEMLKVSIPALEKVMRTAVGSVAFLALSVDDGESRTAMLQDLQTDHMGDKLVHVDFYEVRPDQVLSLEVPISVVGVPAGLDEGGMLEILARSVPVSGKPVEVPDEVTIDVSALNVGDTITFGDIALPEGVKLDVEADMPVVTCVVPAAPSADAGAEEGEEDDEAGSDEKK